MCNPEGQRVQVKIYRPYGLNVLGTIVDTQQPHTEQLYTVELDNPTPRRIHLRDTYYQTGTRVVKLFDDEFELLETKAQLAHIV
jgi:hypothetical protein